MVNRMFTIMVLPQLYKCNSASKMVMYYRTNQWTCNWRETVGLVVKEGEEILITGHAITNGNITIEHRQNWSFRAVYEVTTLSLYLDYS